VHFVDKEPSQKRIDFVDKLKSNQLDRLNIEIKKSNLKRNLKKGIF
jgi:2-methylcitrate dehydratase